MNRNTKSATEAKDIEDLIQAKTKHEFFMPNQKNMKLMDTIKGVSPAYAKHALTKNELINAFAFVMGGGIDFLKQPICDKCEKPCTWGTYDQKYEANVRYATCDCGHVTKNPITVEQYLTEYVKGISPQMLEALRPKLTAFTELIDRGELDE